jgi:uncharacterized protein (TIGR03437 family)
VQANFSSPSGIAFDSQGTLYVADTGNQRVRAIGTDGSVRTVAGSGVVGFAGDNQTADFASFISPVAVAVDASNNVFVADSANNRVRKLTPKPLTGPVPPAITVVNTAYGSTDIGQNDFIEIHGTGLSSTTAGPASLAAQLAGVTVTVNNNPALLYYVSPTQINALTPLDSTTGPVPVVVTNNGTASVAFSGNMKTLSPAFLHFDATGHITATHADGSFLGPASLGSSFTPAVPGETIVTYAVGFGLPVTAGVNGAAPSTGVLPTLPVCQVNGGPATVLFAGLNGYPGLFQLNITLPNTVANGDNPVSCSYGGASTFAGTMVTVQR